MEKTPQDSKKKRVKFGLLTRLKRSRWYKGEYLLAAAAIAIGLLSASVENASRSAYERRLDRMYETDQVIVAQKDLSAGTVLNRSQLSTAKVLKHNLSPNALRPKDLSLIADRKLTVDLRPGDLIYLTMVEGASEAGKLSEKIPPGKRLFTLEVADKSLAYGWIKPNDHVDILAHVTLPGRGETTLTLLQNITLVSVGNATILEGTGKISGGDVSFFVDPREYEVLAFAEKTAKFSISLRNPKDLEEFETSKGVDLDAFLDNSRIQKASGGGRLEVIEDGAKKKLR